MVKVALSPHIEDEKQTDYKTMPFTAEWAKYSITVLLVHELKIVRGTQATSRLCCFYRYNPTDFKRECVHSFGTLSLYFLRGRLL